MVIYTPWRVVKATVKEATRENLPPGRSGVVGGRVQLSDLVCDCHSDDEENDIVIHPVPTRDEPAGSHQIDKLSAQVRDLTSRTNELYRIRYRNGSTYFTDEKTTQDVDDFDPRGPTVFNLDSSAAAFAPASASRDSDSRSDPPSYNSATNSNHAVLNPFNGDPAVVNTNPSSHFTHSHY